MPVPIPEVTAAQAKAKAHSLLTEFQTFLFKGNLVDMAVGIIIGGAFGNLVKSFLDKIMLPFIAAILATAGKEGEKATDAMAKLSSDVNGVNIPWGAFVAELINFLILGAVVFFVIVKVVGALVKWKQQPAAPAAPTKEEILLTEIRDLLAKQRPPLAAEGPKAE